MNATDILGQLLGAGQKNSGSLNSSSGAKMLEDLLGVGKGGNQSGPGGGGVFGGGQTGGGTSGGNAGGAIGQQNSGTGSGGLGTGGGLGDLLGKALKELGRSQAGGQQTPASGSNPFDQTPQQSPNIDQHEQSRIYIRAMIQAGLSDGRIDEQEQQAILQKVGNMDQEAQNFIRSEIAKGSDVNAFIHSVPRGIEEEVYSVSLMAIQLDNRTEAQYLDAVAKGLRISREQSNAIHDKFGVQRLYG